MVYRHRILTIVALLLAASAASPKDISDYDPLFLSQDTLEIDVEGPFAFLARERPDLLLLIADRYEGTLERAVQQALNLVEGAFGLAVLHADEPDKVVGARRGRGARACRGNESPRGCR